MWSARDGGSAGAPRRTVSQSPSTFASVTPHESSAVPDPIAYPAKAARSSASAITPARRRQSLLRTGQLLSRSHGGLPEPSGGLLDQDLARRARLEPVALDARRDVAGLLTDEAHDRTLRSILGAVSPDPAAIASRVRKLVDVGSIARWDPDRHNR